eukprot:gene5296-2416_t
MSDEDGFEQSCAPCGGQPCRTCSIVVWTLKYLRYPVADPFFPESGVLLRPLVVITNKDTCSKTQNAVKYLSDKGFSLSILQPPGTSGKLQELLGQLNGIESVRDIMRKDEMIYVDN